MPSTGPLIGSASRVIFGFVADKIGGAILTTITGIGILAGAIILVTQGLVSPTSMEQFPLFVGVILAMFFFTELEMRVLSGNFPSSFPRINVKRPALLAGLLQLLLLVLSSFPN